MRKANKIIKKYDSVFTIQYFNFSKINPNLGKYFIKNQRTVHASIQPKTVSDLKRIQNYVKTANTNSQVEEDLYRSSKMNDEFNNFFKEFKRKNRGKWESIINGMDVDEELLRKETKSEKQEEIEMLQEFERRRKFKSAYDTLNKVEDDLDVDNKKRLKPKKEVKIEEVDQVEGILKPDAENNEIYDSKKFTLIFLDAGMVCNMTRLNRVYERRILLYMGNKEGMISYGIGRGGLYNEAYTEAYRQLKKNLIVIRQDPLFSCPTDLKARFNDFRIYIRSQYEPKIWGNPIMALMLRYAGLYHCSFVIISRSKEPYAMVFAFFKAVTKNVTPDILAEMSGTKSNNQYIGRPRRYEHSMLPLQHA